MKHGDTDITPTTPPPRRATQRLAYGGVAFVTLATLWYGSLLVHWAPLGEAVTANRRQAMLLRDAVWLGFGSAGTDLPTTTTTSTSTALWESTQENDQPHPQYPSYHDRHPCHFDACQTLQTYINQHSAAQLQAEYDACQGHNKCLAHRSFVIADYSCPHEAGNLLHITMNKVLWAILTNRTVLVRYMTQEVCESICHDGDNDKMCPRCPQANTQADCDAILRVAAWLPQFEDWNDRLQLPPSEAVHPIQGTVDNTTFADDHPRVARLYNKANSIHTIRLANSLQRQNRISPQLGKDLLRQGTFFLYGMLFHALFTIHPDMEPPPHLVANASNTTKTIVVHSRHPQNGDTSTKVQEACLRSWLQDTTKTNHTPDNCVVYIMADRQVSLQQLAKTTRALQCTPRMANHTASTPHISHEHGPYAGAGFFQDVALAAHGRFAFTTNGKSPTGGRRAIRTSSQLVWAIMQYRAAVEGYPKPQSCGFQDIP